LERRPVPGIRVPDSVVLNRLGATFVTLEDGARLLGCIGTIDPVRPLYEDVMTNAYRSAFSDPRLPAITGEEYETMSVKVAVLGPTAPLSVADRAELIGAVEPEVDGLLLVADGFRATFLPAVWARVDSAAEFVDLLLRKGGATGGWLPGLRAYRYRTTEYADPGPRDPLDR
jgi:AmmeMemoRadiSam system protein A